MAPAAVWGRYRKKILEQLRSNLADLTKKDRGIVTEIHNLKARLGDVSPSGSVRVYLSMDATCFLPKEGDEVIATVTRPLAIGVLCSYLALTVWVSKDAMSPLMFSDDGYSDANNEIRVTEGSRIPVTIELVRYERHVFSCIGSLRDVDPKKLAEMSRPPPKDVDLAIPRNRCGPSLKRSVSRDTTGTDVDLFSKDQFRAIRPQVEIKDKAGMPPQEEVEHRCMRPGGSEE